MSLRRDPIAVVEACYDLRASEEDWLGRIGGAVVPLLGAACHGVLAYHLELGERVRILHPVQAGGAEDVVSRIRRMANMLDRRHAGEAGIIESATTKLYEAAIRKGLAEPVDHMMLSEIDKVGPTWMYTLGVPGVRDVFHLCSHHVDGLGATLVISGLSNKRVLRPAERRLFQMLSAHIKAGLRLRRRLGTPGMDPEAPPVEGAVLDANFRVIHAEGEARESSDARVELQEAARRVDGARTQHKGRDAAALEVWQGLIRGTWSLVEKFDTDGKRFLLAHRNPEDVVDPRGLTERESRVTGLAVRGYSNKLIAYHLGISEGTVSTHLHSAMRKLGVGSRVELVRTLGTHYPQATDPRFAN